MSAQAPWHDNEGIPKAGLLDSLRYKAEAQFSGSARRTPLWLNANKHGLSSLNKFNGYVRGQLIRRVETDSMFRWGIGYGVDVAVPVEYTSHVVVQQAWAEVRWLHGLLTVGQKEQPLELKNDRLSSGSQTLGINARPIPQVRLALPDYWAIPGTRRWVSLKGHIAFGMFTDNGWQHDFTGKQTKYGDNVRYHSKAGYIKIGRDDIFKPLSLELGLEMGAQFAGDLYTPVGDGSGAMRKVETNHGFRGFWHAFVPGGGDSPEGLYANTEGNQVGSWVARLNWNADTWRVSLYWDQFFEDHSQMFHLDYDGYGEGDQWNEHTDSRYVLYDFKDMMLGAELELKYGTWLRGLVVEYIYSKYQSGPLNHDRGPTIPDHWAGLDDYYNHYLYPGWQHWGQVIGNPLYRSPIYNDDGHIEVEDNRFMAFHFGAEGNITDRITWRALGTWQEGLGSYKRPYTKKHHNVSFMVEAACRLNHGWRATAAFGLDRGHILGSNTGAQITISKTGVLRMKRKKK